MKKPKQKLALRGEVVKALITQLDEAKLQRVDGAVCPRSAIVNLCGSGCPLCNLETGVG